MCTTCNTRKRVQNRRRFIQSGGAGIALVAGAGLFNSVQADDHGTSEAEHHPHWSYEGETGPEHWSELDPKNVSCSGGTQQSPIDVSGPIEGDLTNIEFDYQTITDVQILNNGHTAYVTVPEGSYITVDGMAYPLKQFHFHSPSEHTIDGVANAMELHLVHITETDDYAVVGVMLAEGDEHLGLKGVFEAIPPTVDATNVFSGGVDLNTLLPAQLTTFRYQGSLTTPPCSEGVRWLLMTERQTVSAAQIEAYRAIFGDSARPVQPLNDRVLDEDTTA
ncbi:MAG: carbonic anhydrase family protein [Thermomicrobiales bacterium]|nr:carbonic anhydrase family protein [Thermomicrobiales bacterium]